jgi:hypothetical protein
MLLIFIINGFTLSAQTYFTYTFEYDDAGNRTKRLSEIVVKNLEVDSLSDYQEGKEMESLTSTDPYTESIAGIDVLLYPNPTDGQLVVELNASNSELTGSLKVFNIEGRLIYTQTEFSQQNLVDLSHQENGIYFLHIQLNSDTKIYKVIKK